MFIRSTYATRLKQLRVRIKPSLRGGVVAPGSPCPAFIHSSELFLKTYSSGAMAMGMSSRSIGSQRAMQLSTYRRMPPEGCSSLEAPTVRPSSRKCVDVRSLHDDAGTQVFRLGKHPECRKKYGGTPQHRDLG